MADFEIDKPISNSVTINKPKKTEKELQETEQEIIQDIINAESKDELQKQFDLFNLTQTKKNAMRISKISGLMSDVEDEIYRRFHKRPDQISNAELLQFLQVLSNQVDKSQRNVDSLEQKELIKKIATTPSTNNDITINLGTSLDKETKDNAMLAVKQILNLIQNSELDPTYTPDNIDEVEIVEETDLNSED